MIDFDSKKLLIFDCDGVMFDSHDANIAYFNRCLEIGGYEPLSGDSVEKIIFMSVRQLLSEIMPDENEVERVFQISQAVDYGEFIPMLEPLFDFNRVFGELRKSHYLAVATNRGRSLLSLFNYYNFYDMIHFKVSTLEAPPKPAPDMLIRCADYFGLRPDDAVFIGDADPDRRAAENAGMNFLWIGGGEGHPSVGNVSDILNADIINVR